MAYRMMHRRKVGDNVIELGFGRPKECDPMEFEGSWKGGDAPPSGVSAGQAPSPQPRPQASPVSAAPTRFGYGVASASAPHGGREGRGEPSGPGPAGVYRPPPTPVAAYEPLASSAGPEPRTSLRFHPHNMGGEGGKGLASPGGPGPATGQGFPLYAGPPPPHIRPPYPIHGPQGYPHWASGGRPYPRMPVPYGYSPPPPFTFVTALTTPVAEVRESSIMYTVSV